MIDQRPAPLAFHVEPGQLVRAIILPVDVNGPIFRAHAAPGDIPGADVRVSLHPPAKLPAARVVVQQLLQPRLCQLGFLHCGPANKKGRKRPGESEFVVSASERGYSIHMLIQVCIWNLLPDMLFLSTRSGVSNPGERTWDYGPSAPGIPGPRRIPKS